MGKSSANDPSIDSSSLAADAAQKMDTLCEEQTQEIGASFGSRSSSCQRLLDASSSYQFLGMEVWIQTYVLELP
jgi:hypothetical protein